MALTNISLPFLLFFKIFLMWTIFKVLIEFVTILLLLFVLWFFGGEAHGIASLPPASEGEVLTTELPGNPPVSFL